MAKWFGDDDVPARFKGKTKEQIDAEITALEAKAAEADAAKAAAAASQAAVAERDASLSELASVKAKLASLEAASRPEPEKTPAKQFTSVAENEDEAFRQRLVDGLTPLYQQQLVTASQLARSEAIAKLSRDPDNTLVLEKFGSEIDELYQTTNMVQRQYPGTYENCFLVVKGKHFADISEAKRKLAESQALEPGASGAAPALPADQSRGDKLTEQELKIAARLGVKPEAYAANRKRATTVLQI